jgi:2Fe-2S ferredoxin
MPTVTFIDTEGTARAVQVAEGMTAMRAAVDNGIPGIDGDCGGQAACGTCHVFVDDAWLELTGPASGHELQMLEMADTCAASSRLACQLILSSGLDGLILRTPEHQV